MARMGVLSLLFCSVLFISRTVLAQAAPQTAVWQGVLRNAASAPVAGAKIHLTGNGSQAEAVTGADGRFQFPGLPPGQYHLIIEEQGRTVESTLAVDLTPGAPAAAITISARGELSLSALQQAAATGGEQLSSQAVSELPLNTRDFSHLLLLAAGTMTDANGATNFTSQFAINGQRGVEATFAMDDADISDPEMGGSTFSNFNVDAVEQIQSSTGWLPAEVGRGAAGFTNIVTRSGSSGFHGSFFEFVRNSAFDARNYFDHPSPVYPGRIPPFRRNEFGFTNGGPVYLPHVYDGRKRTFYFTQYQGFRQVLGTTQVFPVPTAQERAGLDTTAFPNDTLKIPVDPGIAAVLKRYPVPNYPAGAYGIYTYATPSKVNTDANQFSLRLDHKFSGKDRFFARFNMDNLTGPTTNPDQTAIDPSFAVTFFDRQRNVAGTWTRTASPRLTFESTIGIERSTPGFPTPNRTDPAVKFIDGLFEAFNSAAGSVMQSYGNLFQGREIVSYARGNHALKAGVEARLNRDTTYFGISPNGEYDFGGGTAYATRFIPSRSGRHDIHPGDPLPDTLSSFLSGSPFVYTVAIAPPYFSNGPHIGPAAISRNNVSAFVQDTWKVTPRFTLDYGVRWDLYQPITERARRTSSFLGTGSAQQYVINPQPG
ncbi:MAG: TonB-dependent receptor, partial [Acetobacteraceae bacterium]|nr:TonB-dependent receptor [Acetobacteraceae bacterium]